MFQKSYNIKIMYDEFDPRENNEGLLGTIITAHKSYKIGDVEFPKNTIKRNSNFDSAFKDYLEEYHNLTIAEVYSLPVYMYDHGGISISTSIYSCPWDRGQIGFIYTTPKRAKELFAVEKLGMLDRSKIYYKLKNEIEKYNQFVMGNQFVVIVEEVTGTFPHFDVEEKLSTGGVKGEDVEKVTKEMISEAVSFEDAMI